MGSEPVLDNAFSSQQPPIVQHALKAVRRGRDVGVTAAGGRLDQQPDCVVEPT